MNQSMRATFIFFLSLHANDNFIFKPGIVSDDGLLPGIEFEMVK